MKRAIPVLAVLLAVACTTPVPRAGIFPHGSRSAPAQAVSDVLTRRQVLLGYTLEHRPIIAVQVGDPDSPRRVLVVGCIHGNETAGMAIARALTQAAAPTEVDLWVVPDLNPDGVAHAHRGNGHRVDLNRNFPDHWRALGSPGSLHYAGPTTLSEPESRIAFALLRRLRPSLGIWYHQALDVVDTSQGPLALEQRYAHETGMELRALPDYPGSAVGYEDQLVGASGFVVELPAGSLTTTAVSRHVHAVLDSAARSGPPHA